MSTHFYHGCHFLHFHCSKYRSWCLFHLVPQRHCSPALEKKKKKTWKAAAKMQLLQEAPAPAGTPHADLTTRVPLPDTAWGAHTTTASPKTSQQLQDWRGGLLEYKPP